VTTTPPDDEPFRIPIEPELDLHPFAPRDIPSVVEEYVNEAHAAGLSEVRLVHGRGKGVQRGIVQQVLERHTLVIGFRDDASSHLGATVATLRTSNVERRKNGEGET
jgi:dsDNA-specific endonuclease/ATPase MutS2